MPRSSWDSFFNIISKSQSMHGTWMVPHLFNRIHCGEKRTKTQEWIWEYRLWTTLHTIWKCLCGDKYAFIIYLFMFSIFPTWDLTLCVSCPLCNMRMHASLCFLLYVPFIPCRWLAHIHAPSVDSPFNPSFHEWSSDGQERLRQTSGSFIPPPPHPSPFFPRSPILYCRELVYGLYSGVWMFECLYGYMSLYR
jgi:hypothetical protein